MKSSKIFYDTSGLFFPVFQSRIAQWTVKIYSNIWLLVRQGYTQMMLKCAINYNVNEMSISTF